MNGYLSRAESSVRRFALAIVLTLAIGYSIGMRYLYITSDLTQKGIQENYIGNEEDKDAEVMKFKMPEAKVLTIMHTHILSYTFIFTILGILLMASSLPSKLKSFLIIEPFAMVVLNFGLLYLLWDGLTWVNPLIMISGIILTLGFYLSVVLLVKELIFKKK
ncbi:MAG: hypothetical protein HKO93_01665 [Flavobacteriales bacterium]|nr:hypothetical protein [Flavobacteriales bacterium]